MCEAAQVPYLLDHRQNLCQGPSINLTHLINGFSCSHQDINALWLFVIFCPVILVFDREMIASASHHGLLYLLYRTGNDRTATRMKKLLLSTKRVNGLARSRILLTKIDLRQ